MRLAWSIAGSERALKAASSSALTGAALGSSSVSELFAGGFDLSVDVAGGGFWLLPDAGAGGFCATVPAAADSINATSAPVGSHVFHFTLIYDFSCRVHHRMCGLKPVWCCCL